MNERMAGLLEPLAVFCSQPQSQRYVRTIHNLGDSSCTLADTSNLTSSAADQDKTIIETAFDLMVTIKKGLDKQNFSVTIQAPSTLRQAHNPITSAVEGLSGQESSSTPGTLPLRHYRIFADYGTDFIWLNTADPSYSPGNTYVEAADALSSFPPLVLQNYDAWVDTYTDNFKKRCEDTQDYSANVFHTAAEQVAWQVAGYLLAWRITRSPQVGSVEYSLGREKYVLEQGRESDVTLAFLEDQAALLVSW
jgi:hypothetical protein